MTQLYRHFDADDRLLYVGVSLSAVARLQQHNLTADWVHRIARVEIEHFDTREAAIRAEIEAIKSEHPRHNVQHRVPERGSYGAAIDAMGLEPVSGYLPADLAADVQWLIDQYESEAKRKAAAAKKP